MNIFEPFATTKAEGTGLGLPIVQQIDYDLQPAETFPFDQSKERYSN